MTAKLRAFAAKPFVRGIAVSTAIKALGTLLGILGTFVLARHLGSTEYGRFAYLSAMFQLLSFFVLLGGNKYLLQQARHQGTASPAVRSAFAVTCVIGLIGLAGTLTVFTILTAKGILAPGEPAVYLFGIGAILLPTLWLVQILNAVWRIDEQPARAETANSFLNRISVLIVMGVGLLFGVPETGIGFFAANTAYMAVAYAIFALPLWPVFRNVWRNLPEKGEFGRALRLCGGFTIINVSGRGMELVPVILLGMLARPEDAGLLNIALKLFLPVALINQAVTINLLPRIARAVNENAVTDRMVWGIRIAAGAILGLTTLYFGVLVFAGPWLLGLLGDEFRAALVPVLLLIGGRMAKMLLGRNENYLEMCGRTRLLAAVQFVGLAVLVSVLALAPGISLVVFSGLLSGVWVLTGIVALVAVVHGHGLVLSPIALLCGGSGRTKRPSAS